MTDSDGDDYPSDLKLLHHLIQLLTDEHFDDISSEEAAEDCDLIEEAGEDMADGECTHCIIFSIF